MTIADDFVSEAEALADQLEDYDIEPSRPSGSWSSMVRRETKKDKKLYEKNKKAKVGTKLICAGPKCGNTFIKKHYQQAFCCTKHKNQYWNRQRLLLI